MPVMLIGVIAVLLLTVWAGVEADHVVTEYPAESIFAVSAVTAVAVGVAVARFRAANRRVSLTPATRGTVIAAAPVRPAIRAVPARRPEPPAPTAPKTGEKCDGPGCGEVLDDDPWHCGGIMPDGHQVSGQFCSKRCNDAWQQLMTTRHSGRPSP